MSRRVRDREVEVFEGTAVRANRGKTAAQSTATAAKIATGMTE